MNLYWADTKGLQKMAIGGGAVTTLVAGYAIASIAVDSTRVYYSDGQWLRSVAKTGGSPKVYAGGSTTVTAMQLYQGSAGSVIYWAEQNAAIRSVSTAGGYITTHQAPISGRRASSVFFDGVLWTDCAYPNANACALRKRQWSSTWSLSVGVGAGNVQGDAAARAGSCTPANSSGRPPAPAGMC